MVRSGRRWFLFLVALCVTAPWLTRPVASAAARQVRFTHVPGFFPAEPDNESLGPVHGGVAVDRAGRIYVSTDTPRGIVVFGPDGKFLRSFGPSMVHGLYLRREAGGEYLYAARPSAHEVMKIKTDGTVAWTMGYPKESGVYAKSE